MFESTISPSFNDATKEHSVAVVKMKFTITKDMEKYCAKCRRCRTLPMDSKTTIDTRVFDPRSPAIHLAA